MNFDNDWGHFCDPDDNNDNNNNNIFYNNLCKHIKKKIKKVEEKKIEEPFIDIKKLNINNIKNIDNVKNINYEYEYENDDIKKYIVDVVFNCISVIFITFVSFKIHHLTGIN